MAKDLTGTTLGRYQILERLGRGGMADVYRAYQPSMDRFVAVKVMHGHLTENADFITRFKREAQSVGALRHPNIVQVIDFDVQDDEYYMVMEYIQGDTLKALLQKTGRLPVHEALDIAIKLADALAYAHEAGVIHRDIKPANVLMTANNNPVLSDFGIARLMDASGLTTSGMTIGTPAYMSPEAGRGEKADARSDIYSLGIVLYEMLTGTLPYDADTPYAIILKHINDPLPLPRQFVEELPESVERIILKTLAKTPEERYQKAAILRDALEQAQYSKPTEPIVAPLSSAMPTPVEFATQTNSMASSPLHSPSNVQTPRPTATGPVSAVSSTGTPVRSNRAAIAAVVIASLALVGVGVIIALLLRPSFIAPLPPRHEGDRLTMLPGNELPGDGKPLPSMQAIGQATIASGINKYTDLTAKVEQEINADEFDQALANVNAALSSDPQSYDLLILRARVNATTRKSELMPSVQQDAEAALKIDSKRPDAYTVLGYFYQYTPASNTDEIVANLKKAIENFNSAIDKNANNHYPYWFRAKANETLNSYIGADRGVPRQQITDDWEKAASYSPKDTGFYSDRGQYYFDLQNYDLARQSFEKVIQINPSYVEAYGYLASVEILQGKADQAYTMYQGLVEKDKQTDPKLLANAAYAARAAGKADQADQWAALALTLEPKTPAALYLQALRAWDQKNYDLAVQKLDAVSQFDKYDYYYPFLQRALNHHLYVDKGRILAAQGKFSDAIDAYSTAISDQGDWIQLYIERGKLYVQQNQPDNARQDFRTAYELAINTNDDKTKAQALDLLKQLGDTPTETTEIATETATP